LPLFGAAIILEGNTKMKKSITQILFAAILMFSVLSLSACDNADYTEYGGSITTLDAAGIEAAYENYEQSSILSSIENQAEETTSYYEGIDRPDFEPLKKTTVDREGNTIDVPENVDTIISGAPAITEILSGLGLADKIIAADTYSADVAGVDPEVCTLDFFNLNIEELVMLDPDLIIISGMSVWGGDDPYAVLRDMGAAVVYIPTSNTIEGIKLDIEFIGTMTGEETRAGELISDINTKILEIREAVEGLPKPTVYLEMEQLPVLYSCGADTLFNELLTIAGGENIYASESGWIQNSVESVIMANPEYIISCAFYTTGLGYQEIGARSGWEVITAVKNNNIYAVNPNTTSRPSQNVVYAIEEMAKILHPEAFN
jgi:iron complex transport system substrate-binding protein